jgi:hypothetical protein
MLIKFLNVGTGDPKKAASYVLGEKDHTGKIRAGVEILRGDPEIFNSLSQSVRFQYCYTSAVIAWAPEDQVTDAQINEVLNVFEAHAFAGLEQDQYHMTAVQHLEDDGSRHLHILIPRLELRSGKSLNVAPPGHQHYFDPLRDYFNYKYQWVRPDDPLRMKDLILPSHLQLHDAAAVKTGLQASKKKARIELIHQFVETRILHEVIYDRTSLLKALAEIGQVGRKGKDYISITTNEGTDRLRGAFYHEQFSFTAYCENRRRAEIDEKSQKFDARHSAEYSEQLQHYVQRLETVRNKRKQYNQTYYTTARVSRDVVRIESSPASEIERAADDCDPRERADGSRIDGTTSHEPTAVSGHQNSVESTKVVSRALSKRHEYNPRDDQQKQQPIEHGGSKNSTAVSSSTTEWIAKISGYSKQLSKNTEIYFDLNRYQHLHADRSIHLNRGTRYETDTTATNEKRITARFTTRNRVAEAANTAVSTDTARTAEYSAIAAQLSEKITAADRAIRIRAEQQKRDTESISKRTFETARNSRFKQLFNKIGDTIQSSIQRIFALSRSSNAHQARDTESNGTAFELASSFGIDRLVKHAKRLFATKIDARDIERYRQSTADIARLDSNLQKLARIIKRTKFPTQSLASSLEHIHDNHQFISLSDAIRSAEQADKFIKSKIKAMHKNRWSEESKNGLHVDYARCIKFCCKQLTEQLYDLKKENFQYIYTFIDITKRYSEMIELNHQDIRIDPYYFEIQQDILKSLENLKNSAEGCEIKKGFKIDEDMKVEKQMYSDQEQATTLSKPKMMKELNSEDLHRRFDF